MICLRRSIRKAVWLWNIESKLRVVTFAFVDGCEVEELAFMESRYAVLLISA